MTELHGNCSLWKSLLSGERENDRKWYEQDGSKQNEGLHDRDCVEMEEEKRLGAAKRLRLRCLRVGSRSPTEVDLF